MSMIDSHQHFWQLGRFAYSWLTPDSGILYRDYLPDELYPQLEQAGMTHTVLVQADSSTTETAWMLDLADRYGWIAGVVGWIDLQDLNLKQTLDSFAIHPRYRGVRVAAREAGWWSRTEIMPGLHALAERNLTLDVLTPHSLLAELAEVARELPKLHIIIDHLAHPQIATHQIDQWQSNLEHISTLPNVFCKLSGMVTLANHINWKPAELQPYIAETIRQFGHVRCMYGSDWPVCRRAGEYQRVLKALRDQLEPAEQEAIFSTTAIRAYRLALNPPL